MKSHSSPPTKKAGGSTLNASTMASAAYRSQSAQQEKEFLKMKRDRQKHCERCGSEFSFLRRKKTCFFCECIVCGNCCGPLKDRDGKVVGGGGLLKSGPEMCHLCTRNGRNNGGWERGGGHSGPARGRGHDDDESSNANGSESAATSPVKSAVSSSSAAVALTPQRDANTTTTSGSKYNNSGSVGGGGGGIGSSVPAAGRRYRSGNGGIAAANDSTLSGGGGIGSFNPRSFVSDGRRPPPHRMSRHASRLGPNNNNNGGGGGGMAAVGSFSYANSFGGGLGNSVGPRTLPRRGLNGNFHQQQQQQGGGQQQRSAAIALQKMAQHGLYSPEGCGVDAADELAASDSYFNNKNNSATMAMMMMSTNSLGGGLRVRSPPTITVTPSHMTSPSVLDAEGGTARSVVIGGGLLPPVREVGGNGGNVSNFASPATSHYASPLLMDPNSRRHPNFSSSARGGGPRSFNGASSLGGGGLGGMGSRHNTNNNHPFVDNNNGSFNNNNMMLMSPPSMPTIGTHFGGAAAAQSTNTVGSFAARSLHLRQQRQQTTGGGGGGMGMSNASFSFGAALAGVNSINNNNATMFPSSPLLNRPASELDNKNKINNTVIAVPPTTTAPPPIDLSSPPPSSDIPPWAVDLSANILKGSFGPLVMMGGGGGIGQRTTMSTEVPTGGDGDDVVPSSYVGSLPSNLFQKLSGAAAAAAAARKRQLEGEEAAATAPPLLPLLGDASINDNCRYYNASCQQDYLLRRILKHKNNSSNTNTNTNTTATNSDLPTSSPSPPLVLPPCSLSSSLGLCLDPSQRMFTWIGESFNGRRLAKDHLKACVQLLVLRHPMLRSAARQFGRSGTVDQLGHGNSNSNDNGIALSTSSAPSGPQQLITSMVIFESAVSVDFKVIDVPINVTNNNGNNDDDDPSDTNANAHSVSSSAVASMLSSPTMSHPPTPLPEGAAAASTSTSSAPSIALANSHSNRNNNKTSSSSTSPFYYSSREAAIDRLEAELNAPMDVFTARTLLRTRVVRYYTATATAATALTKAKNGSSRRDGDGEGEENDQHGDGGEKNNGEAAPSPSSSPITSLKRLHPNNHLSSPSASSSSRRENVLVGFALHPLVGDEHSLKIFIGELQTLYKHSDQLIQITYGQPSSSSLSVGTAEDDNNNKPRSGGGDDAHKTSSSDAATVVTHQHNQRVIVDASINERLLAMLLPPLRASFEGTYATVEAALLVREAHPQNTEQRRQFWTAQLERGGAVLEMPTLKSTAASGDDNGSSGSSSTASVVEVVRHSIPTAVSNIILRAARASDSNISGISGVNGNVGSTATTNFTASSSSSAMRGAKGSTIALAAYALALLRYTSQDTVAIATQVTATRALIADVLASLLRFEDASRVLMSEPEIAGSVAGGAVVRSDFSGLCDNTIGPFTNYVTYSFSTADGGGNSNNNNAAGGESHNNTKNNTMNSGGNSLVAAAGGGGPSSPPAPTPSAFVGYVQALLKASANGNSMYPFPLLISDGDGTPAAAATNNNNCPNSNRSDVAHQPPPSSSSSSSPSSSPPFFPFAQAAFIDGEPLVDHLGFITNTKGGSAKAFGDVTLRSIGGNRRRHRYRHNGQNHHHASSSSSSLPPVVVVPPPRFDLQLRYWIDPSHDTCELLLEYNPNVLYGGGGGGGASNNNDRHSCAPHNDQHRMFMQHLVQNIGELMANMARCMVYGGSTNGSIPRGPSSSSSAAGVMMESILSIPMLDKAQYFALIDHMNRGPQTSKNNNHHNTHRLHQKKIAAAHAKGATQHQPQEEAEESYVLEESYAAMRSHRGVHGLVAKSYQQYKDRVAIKMPEAAAAAMQHGGNGDGNDASPQSPLPPPIVSLTYGELDRVTAAIARMLKTQFNVKPNDVVAIAMHRRVEQMACVLGVLRSGAAYLPLDVSYPADRLSFMLNDSNVACVLTTTEVSNKNPQSSLKPLFDAIAPQEKIVCIGDNLMAVIAPYLMSPHYASSDGADGDKYIDGDVDPESTTYVIYTSGSTGKPKGVVMNHRAHINLVLWQNHYVKPRTHLLTTSTPSDAAALNGNGNVLDGNDDADDAYVQVLQFSPISFDVSFQELFTTWSQGGCIVMVSESLRLDPLNLIRFLNRHTIHRLFVPFVALSHIAETAAECGEYPTTLVDVITAGEQLIISRPVIALFDTLRAKHRALFKAYLVANGLVVVESSGGTTTDEDADAENDRIIKAFLLAQENANNNQSSTTTAMKRAAPLLKQQHPTDIVLHNHYGPSETHVCSYHVLRGDPHQWMRLPPIGVPIANTQLYVLDDYQRPVPLGTVGELYIAGACLGTGYLNRPDVTRAAFVECPFEYPQPYYDRLLLTAAGGGNHASTATATAAATASTATVALIDENKKLLFSENNNSSGAVALTTADHHSHRKMYKTGDLVQMMPDGNILYIRRKDTQVKVRGFRIELGEIEARLSQSAEVRKCCVIVREDIAVAATTTAAAAVGGADKKVVAYVVPTNADVYSVGGGGGDGENNDSSSFSSREKKKLRVALIAALKAELRQHMPEYMVPSLILFMAALPLTPSGKINRKGLPVPSEAQTAENAAAMYGGGGDDEHDRDGDDGPSSSSGGNFVEPVNVYQSRIRDIWAAVLKTKAELISINSSFFALGGHSLTVTKMLSRVNNAFTSDPPLPLSDSSSASAGSLAIPADFIVEVPVTFAFDNPSVEAIARYVEDAVTKQWRRFGVDGTNGKGADMANGQVMIMSRQGTSSAFFSDNALPDCGGVDALTSQTPAGAMHINTSSAVTAASSDVAPLTFNQQSMLYLQTARPETACVYNISVQGLLRIVDDEDGEEDNRKGGRSKAKRRGLISSASAAKLSSPSRRSSPQMGYGSFPHHNNNTNSNTTASNAYSSFIVGGGGGGSAASIQGSGASAAARATSGSMGVGGDYHHNGHGGSGRNVMRPPLSPTGSMASNGSVDDLGGGFEDGGCHNHYGLNDDSSIPFNHHYSDVGIPSGGGGDEEVDDGSDADDDDDDGTVLTAAMIEQIFTEVLNKHKSLGTTYYQDAETGRFMQRIPSASSTTAASFSSAKQGGEITSTPMNEQNHQQPLPLDFAVHEVDFDEVQFATRYYSPLDPFFAKNQLSSKLRASPQQQQYDGNTNSAYQYGSALPPRPLFNNNTANNTANHNNNICEANFKALTEHYATVPGDGMDAVRHALHTESITPFDLTRDSLMRVRLYRKKKKTPLTTTNDNNDNVNNGSSDGSRRRSGSGASSAILQIVFHHIAVDLWSMDLIMDDVMAKIKAAMEASRMSRSGDGGGGDGVEAADPYYNLNGNGDSGIHHETDSAAVVATSKPQQPLSLPISSSSAVVQPTYVDYARYLQSKTSRTAAETINYWRRKLRVDIRDLPILELPTDYPRPQVATTAGDVFTFTVPSDIAEGLRRLSKTAGSTMYTSLLSLLFTALHKLSWQEEVIIGTPFGCRNEERFEEVVGYFINSCPIIQEFTGAGAGAGTSAADGQSGAGAGGAAQSFMDILRDCKTSLKEALQHQDYPFPLLADRLLGGAPRSTSHSPVFQTLFTFQEPQLHGELAPFIMYRDGYRYKLAEGVVWESIAIPTHHAMYDVVFQFAEVRRRERDAMIITNNSTAADDSTSAPVMDLVGTIEYNTDLFTRGTIGRMIEVFNHIARQVIRDPSTPIASITTLPDGQRHAVLTTFNEHPMSTITASGFYLRFGGGGNNNNDGRGGSNKPIAYSSSSPPSAPLDSSPPITINMNDPLDCSYVSLFDKIVARYGQCEALSFGLPTTTATTTAIAPNANSVDVASAVAAAVGGVQTVSYAQLYLQSLAVAKALLLLSAGGGIAKGEIIGISLRRCNFMVAAMLGVMRCGAAYVPLDPNYPLDRLEYMTRDAGCKVVIVGAADQHLYTAIGVETVILLEELIECAGAFVEKHMPLLLLGGTNNATDTTATNSALSLQNVLDAEMVELPAKNTMVTLASLLPAVEGSSLAYVIYTSGSTGRPKGTLLAHRGLVNLCYAIRHGYRMRFNRCRFLLFASSSFDASVLEIFAPLGNAGTVVMLSERPIVDQQLADAMAVMRVTTAVLPPPVLATMPEDGFPSPYLETLITAGEAINDAVMTRWRSKGVRMINAYGPTENTVASTLCDYDAEQLVLVGSNKKRRDPVVSSRLGAMEAAERAVEHEPEHHRRLLALGSGVGPSSSSSPVTNASAVAVVAKAPPIGRPIANTCAYVVDAMMNPVGIGIPGELVVTGPGVALGYHRQPEKTRQSFVPNMIDPIQRAKHLLLLQQQQSQSQEESSGVGVCNSAKPKQQKDVAAYIEGINTVGPSSTFATLYRTGDLVRWLPSGNIEFLGRIDGQVKLRGNRIELGEVEAVMLRFTDGGSTDDDDAKKNKNKSSAKTQQQQPIREAAVDIRMFNGSKALVGYVVLSASSSSSSPITVAQLKAFMRRELPEYMVPSVILTLPRLPLSPSGKVDRKSLPNPPNTTTNSTTTTAAGGGAGDNNATAIDDDQQQQLSKETPQTAAQSVITMMVAEVLGRTNVKSVGVNDDFFELGGHSLAAMQLISRIREQFGVEIPIAQIFSSSVIGAIAEAVESALGTNGVYEVELRHRFVEHGLSHHHTNDHHQNGDGGVVVRHGANNNACDNADNYDDDYCSEESEEEYDSDFDGDDNSGEALHEEEENAAINPDNVFPLSYNQEALWFAYCADPKSAALNVTFAAKVDGGGGGNMMVPPTDSSSSSALPSPSSSSSEFNKEAFIKALVALSLLNPILRTVYHSNSDAPTAGPTQSVRPHPSLMIEEVAWDDTTVRDEAAQNKRIERDSHTPLNLEECGPWRVFLYGRREQIQTTATATAAAIQQPYHPNNNNNTDDAASTTTNGGAGGNNFVANNNNNNTTTTTHQNNNSRAPSRIGGGASTMRRGSFNTRFVVTHFTLLFHHIASDLGSIEAVVRQLGVFYNNALAPPNSLVSQLKITDCVSARLKHALGRLAFTGVDKFLLRAERVERRRLMRLAQQQQRQLTTLSGDDGATAAVTATGSSSSALAAGGALTKTTTVSHNNASSSFFLPVNYVDYVHWQRETLMSPKGDLLFAAWQRALAGCPASTNLPTDRPRSVTSSHRGGAEIIPQFTAERFSRVVETAKALGTTPMSVLLASVFTWANRVTGQSDLVIGLPASGRTRVELENVVGDFVNLLPIRVVLDEEEDVLHSDHEDDDHHHSDHDDDDEAASSPTPSSASGGGKSPVTIVKDTFRACVKKTKASLGNALMYQDYPFQLMAQRLLTHRDPTRTPFFQIMVVHEKPHHSIAQLSPFVLGDEGGLMQLGEHLTLRSVPMQEHTCQYDLVFAISEGEMGRVDCRIQYDSDLFNAETIRRFASQWLTVLGIVTANPSVAIGKISLQSEEERAAIAAINAATADDFAADDDHSAPHHGEDVDPTSLTAIDTPIAEIFEKSVELFPNDVALRDSMYNRTTKALSHDDAAHGAVNDPSSKTLTYAELNVCASIIAARIRDALRETCGEYTEQDDAHAHGHNGGGQTAVGTCNWNVCLLMPRSVEYLVTIVAAVKAGAVYTPIDVKVPLQRAQYICDDSDCSVIITTAGEKAKAEEIVANLTAATARASPRRRRKRITIIIIEDDFIATAKQKMAEITVAAASPLEKARCLVTCSLVVKPLPRALRGSMSPLYTIYTSGSTGNPKGVVIHNQGVANVCKWFCKAHKVVRGDVSAQALGAAFDPVTIEVWPYLFVGASVVVMDEDSKLGGPEATIRFLHDHSVTHLTFPTVLSQLIFAEGQFPTDGSFKLRSWSCGGDKFKGTDRPLPFAVVNAYGPTECCVLCSQYAVNYEVRSRAEHDGLPRAADPSRLSLDPPLGRPTANTALYVLDDQLLPVSRGVVGELCVGGAQVGVAYRNNAAATRKAFVADPFQMHSKYARLCPTDSHHHKHKHRNHSPPLVPHLYRTGDLVRLDEHFNIHFVGRKDHQVKIRGFRIELGEIHDQVERCKEVQSAQVIVFERPGTDTKRLYAFITLKKKKLSTSTDDAADGVVAAEETAIAPANGTASASATAAATRIITSSHLPERDSILAAMKAHLTDYMVPVLVIISAFPMTPNGKVDRSALPQLLLDQQEGDGGCMIDSNGGGESSSQQNNNNGSGFVAPSTEPEARMCAIWEEILHTKPIGMADNWYDKGGSSLTSTMLLSRMRQVFQMEVNLQQFFADPTVQGLMRIVEEKGDAAVASNLNAILDADAEDLPATICSHGGGGGNAEDPHPDVRGGAVEHTDDGRGGANPNLLPYVEGPNGPSAIFLTGATGFLGASLLHELLTVTNAMIYCLVRANSDDDASRRIVENLARYEILEAVGSPQLVASYLSRIVPVVGHLDQSNFGLSTAKFDELCRTIDVIFHNGAAVNFVYPYVSLKAANVGGTVTGLRLATTYHLKPFHLVSTLSTVPTPDDGGDDPAIGKVSDRVVSERRLGAAGDDLHGGYTQSKWVAEKLVDLAMQRGVPCTIHRPGRITGNTTTGATNTDDFLNLLIQGCLQLKSIPLLEMPCEMMPVDFCARAIVAISLQRYRALGLRGTVELTAAMEGTDVPELVTSPTATATASASPPPQYYAGVADPSSHLPYIFHLTNESAMPWEQLMRTVLKHGGYDGLPGAACDDGMEWVPSFQEWRAKRLLKLRGDSHCILLKLVPMLGEAFEREAMPLKTSVAHTRQMLEWMASSTSSSTAHGANSGDDGTNSGAAADSAASAIDAAGRLRGIEAAAVPPYHVYDPASLACPLTDEGLVAVYTRYFVHSKFLPQPTDVAQNSLERMIEA